MRGGALLDPDTNGAAPGSRPMVASSPASADAGFDLDAGKPPPDAAAARPSRCALEETEGANERCYVRVAAPLTWDAARTNCQQRGFGWDLTSIRSASDSAFVSTLLDDETWVGGSDEEAEETWAWVDDGFQFWRGGGLDGQPLNGAFVNWFDDEPNGASGSDCLRLLGDSRWADLECTELRASVCEGPPS
jgi:Lectin C-type domain